LFPFFSLNSDVPLIRDAISEKLGTFFFCVAGFIAGYCISFTTAWKVGLVTLAGTPVLIITVALVGKALTMYSAKGQKVYAFAGTIAQEVLSSFFIFHSFFKIQKCNFLI